MRLRGAAVPCMGRSLSSLIVTPLLPAAGHIMTDKNVWFVTGAGRGMGVDIVKSALAAGHRVVATGRNVDVVTKVLGKADDLRVGKLDVTRPEEAEAAAAAAVARFGRIDVLVNNAGNFYAAGSAADSS